MKKTFLEYIQRKKYIILVILALILLIFSTIHFHLDIKRLIKSPQTENPSNNQQRDDRSIDHDEPPPRKLSPAIFIQSSDHQYQGGGVMSQTVNTEPTIELSAYDFKGEVEISLFRTDETFLLKNLIHDEKGQQISNLMDTKKMQFIGKLTHEIAHSDDRYTRKSTPILLPIKEKGIYFLSVDSMQTNDGKRIHSESFIIRSTHAILTREGNNELIFWGIDTLGGKSTKDGQLQMFSLLQKVTPMGSSTFGNDGTAKVAISEKIDIALARIGDDTAIIPINLRYLNYATDDYKYFKEKVIFSKYFSFTDRPLYRPGDKVFFKSFIRDDDDARYTIPSGEVRVILYHDYDRNNPILDKFLTISSKGSVNGEYELDKEAKVGTYCLDFSRRAHPSSGWGNESTTCFQVQYFRKPEYWISASTPEFEYISKDKTNISIKGNYFSGHPLSDQMIKYRVTSTSFPEYYYWWGEKIGVDELSNYGNRFDAPTGNVVIEGEVVTDSSGGATIPLDTSISESISDSQVFTIEVGYDNGSGNPAYDKKNILVHRGEYFLTRGENSYDQYYENVVNKPLQFSILAKPHFPDKTPIQTEGINLKADIVRNYQVSFKKSDDPYTHYETKMEPITSLSTTTDKSGKATFSFLPTKKGSYVVSLSGKDKRNNIVKSTLHFYVTEENNTWSVADPTTPELSIALDKDEYLPLTKAHLTISSKSFPRSVFVSIFRDRVDRYFVIDLEKNVTTYDFDLIDADLPNTSIEVATFTPFQYFATSLPIKFSKDSKKLKMTLSPDQNKYSPAGTANFSIKTTDEKGMPKSAEVAFWLVDKALYELIDEKPDGIFQKFWADRYANTSASHSLEGIEINAAEGGGCFVGETEITLSDGKKAPIKNIKVGDSIQTFTDRNNAIKKTAIVTAVHSTQVDQILIINKSLSLTPEHIIYLNDKWQTAGSAQKGDALLSENGKKIPITSIEYLFRPTTVYNLSVKEKNTFFADGFYVHNQKGPAPRTTFKDVAYWNPSIQTDENGEATVSIKLPDNLTTWLALAVAATDKTEVGFQTQEILVSKDVIIHPLLPNILRAGDNLRISALLQNYSLSDNSFDVSLNSPNLLISEATKSAQFLKMSSSQSIHWQTKVPQITTNDFPLTFSAFSPKNPENSDTVSISIPMRPYQYKASRSLAGEDDQIFNHLTSPDSMSGKSEYKLSLSPSILKSLPTAIDYLIGYPYGCMEQTTSHLMALIVAKSHPEIFAESTEGKDIDDMIAEGLYRLKFYQHADGGWAWYRDGVSDPFITAYIMDFFIQAKSTGVTIEKEMYDAALNFLVNTIKTETNNDPRSNTMRTADEVASAFIIAKAGKPIKKLTELNNLTPDLLAYAVMANFLSGDKNADTNGLKLLISKAKTHGDGLYWEKGAKINFGSIDTSTILAMKAIMTAKGDLDIVKKAARYLMRNRSRSYWSNTFATSQAISTLTDLSRSLSEVSPNFEYEVTLDGNKIASGKVSDLSHPIQDIEIPSAQIKPNSAITIKKSGTGRLYSNLTINEVLTTPQIPPLSKGINITRSYENTKGSNHNIAVGDLVNVHLTISGLEDDTNYLIISDELPSGMIPINDIFKNQQFDRGEESALPVFDFSNIRQNYVDDKEITENGINIYLTNVNSGNQSYTYQARVVNAGNFVVPPATASLMYEPEIYARSATAPMTIATDPVIGPTLIPSHTPIPPTDEPLYRFNRQPETQSPMINFLGKSISSSDMMILIKSIFLMLGVIVILILVKKFSRQNPSSDVNAQSDLESPQKPETT